MANCKEKNLLNEITYLSRLIGQHRQCQAALNRKWDRRIASNSSHVNSQLPNAFSNLNKYSKSVGITSFKSIQSICKQRPSPYNKVNSNHQKKSQLSSQGEQNLKVYVNPKFSNGSVENRLADIDSKNCSHGSKVLINPNFCNKPATEAANVHINPNFRSGTVNNKSEVHVNPISKNTSTAEQKVKVLMNPKFCMLLPDNSPHTQLRSLMSNKVHVNPKLVERVLKEKNEGCNFGPKTSVNSTNKSVKIPSLDELSNNVFTESDRLGVQKLGKSESYTPQCSLRKSEFMTLGKRKLVRIERRPLKLENELKFQEKLRVRRNSISSSKQKPLIVFSPSRTVKKAKSVISKYKLIKLQSTSQITTRKMCVSTKYKIDRRSLSMKNTAPNCSYKNNLIVRHKKLIKTPERKRRFSISSTRTSNGNLVWRRTWSLQAKEFKTTNTKLYRIGSSPILKKNTDIGNKNTNICNTSLVCIGGVLYKSSRNKLTRSNSLNIASKNKTPAIASKRKGKEISKRQVLFIRGQKFIMDAQGKTLKRLSSSNSAIGNKSVASNYSFQRVDIGGVTFVKKSSNVLTRTNTHKARTLLSYAKQKSIATLMKKLKKNNQPCIFFHKFGRCLRMEKGTCPCVHDRKNVAVCKRFLQAKCSIDGCLLSHDVVPEKMPTCRYFLEGCCNRANCPYLHVKVNAKADICTKFLQGYCSDGRKCKKRHVHICPDFEKKGKCMKGKNCPYPHENKRLKRNFVKKKIPVQTAKLPLNNKKFSTEINKVICQPKGELQRYYLAPEETIRQSSIEASRPDKQLNKECSEKLSIMCGTEVSKTSGSVPVVTNRDVNLSTCKRGYEREKIGTLPSFIPL